MAEVTNQKGVIINQQPIVIRQRQISQNDEGHLKGSGARYNMGRLIVVCGIVQIVLTILSLCLSDFRYSCTVYNNVGWGIWNGVFAIIAGSFGIHSRRKKGMVIAFLVLAIIATLMSGLCCGVQAMQANWCTTYGYGGRVAIYIIICVAYALEILFCITGASFTCVALCHHNQPQHVIVYQPYNTLSQEQYNMMTTHAGVVNMAAQPANMRTTNSAPPPYQFISAQPV